MALAEKRICEHTDATTISSADEFIVDSMANGTRNITMTNLENQILSTDTYSALSGIGDGTITGSIADIDSNLNNLTYDSTTNRLTMTGNTAFSGTIDSSPTAGSGNAVSSGGTKTYVDSAVSQLNDEIDAKVKKLATQDVSYTCTSTNYEYTGVNTTCPAGHTYMIRAQVRYSNAQPAGIIASAKNTSSYFYERYAASEVSGQITFMLNAGETAYIWGRWATANKTNSVILYILDITN